MIRYANISADLKEAMLKFCMEQSACVGFEEVKRLVDSAFTTFNKIPEKWFKVMPVFSYLLYMRGNYADEILPNSIKENGVIIERGINLGTFIIDHYSCDTGEKIVRGYDVVYDLDKREIALIYRIEVMDKGVRNLYRVETDLFEDFDVWQFMFDITSDISDTLRRKIALPTTIIFKGKEAV